MFYLEPPNAFCIGIWHDAIGTVCPVSTNGLFEMEDGRYRYLIFTFPHTWWFKKLPDLFLELIVVGIWTTTRKTEIIYLSLPRSFLYSRYGMIISTRLRKTGGSLILEAPKWRSRIWWASWQRRLEDYERHIQWQEARSRLRGQRLRYLPSFFFSNDWSSSCIACRGIITGPRTSIR